jgi:hypothetical protein
VAVRRDARPAERLGGRLACLPESRRIEHNRAISLLDGFEGWFNIIEP